MQVIKSEYDPADSFCFYNVIPVIIPLSSVTQKRNRFSFECEGFFLVSSQRVFLAAVVSGLLIRDLDLHLDFGEAAS